MYLVSILGLNWHSLQPWLYLLAALVLLVSGGGLYWFGIIARRVAKSENATPRASRTGSMIPNLQSKAGRIAKTLGIMVFAASGWIWHYAHYEKDYTAWQQRSAEYQKAYAAWAARQPKKEIR